MNRRKARTGAKRARPRPESPLTLLVEAAAWRTAPRSLKPLLARAVEAALTGAGVAPEQVSLTLLLADDARLQALNAEFRGKDKPTNVLSFPVLDGDGTYLGDVAIAHGVTAREAKAAGKRLTDHAAHLAVHGVLHLLGYDHERDRDARKMEALERTILAGLGIADPYAEAKAA